METIVITGAGGGIGIEAVRALAAPNRTLLCIDVTLAAVERATVLGEDLPGTIVGKVSALENAGECRRLLKPYDGTIIGLAHLAGVFEQDLQTIDDMDVYDRAIRHNLTNAYLVAHAAFEGRDPDTVGSQVFVSSSAFRRGAPFHVPYGIAKAGIVGLTRSLGRRFAPHVRVNALAPGIIDTPMPAHVIAARGADAIAAEVPLGRIGRPEEVASAIAFLMGEGASFISCQTINIDGGMLAS